MLIFRHFLKQLLAVRLNSNKNMSLNDTNFPVSLLNSNFQVLPTFEFAFQLQLSAFKFLHSSFTFQLQFSSFQILVSIFRFPLSSFALQLQLSSFHIPVCISTPTFKFLLFQFPHSCFAFQLQYFIFCFSSFYIPFSLYDSNKSSMKNHCFRVFKCYTSVDIFFHN